MTVTLIIKTQTLACTQSILHQQRSSHTDLPAIPGHGENMILKHMCEEQSADGLGEPERHLGGR